MHCVQRTDKTGRSYMERVSARPFGSNNVLTQTILVENLNTLSQMSKPSLFNAQW